MPEMPLVSLTTDFGLEDTYVGQMKAAALAVAPRLRIVDLCHAVPAHDVRTGAWIVETGCAGFPPGTIHVVVVDPGVGTDRAAVAVETDRFVFVGPDNGVLSRALAGDPPRRTHRIENRRYARPSRATTFDGRDRFAPAAAWLARGVDLAELGPPADDLVRLAGGTCRPRPGRREPVAVVLVDRFGNAVLDVRAADLGEALGGPVGAAGRLSVAAGGRRIDAFRTAYAAGPEGEPFLLVGSSGYLEIAVDGAPAAERLGLAPGDRVELLAEP